MHTYERQQHILKVAHREGFVSIPKTAKKLGVSVETIRRDINLLCRTQLLKKVYGGAKPTKMPVQRDAAFAKRVQQNQQGKITIAAAAAAMIRDGSVVAFGGGASTLALVNQLKNVQDVTFVTTSIRLASILMDKLEQGEITGKTIIIGGSVEPINRTTIFSPAAMDELETYHFDTCFVSCTALSAEAVTNGEESAYGIRRMLRQSSQRILLVDSEKLGKTSLYTFAKPTDFDYIVTDDEASFPPDIRKALEGTNSELIVVPIENK